MKPVRIIPVYRPGKGHDLHPDGYVVHPEDRAVREIKPEKRRRK